MAKKMSVKELEDVLLDQIEKLNDDSIMDDPEKAKILIDKSKSMTDLTNAYIGGAENEARCRQGTQQGRELV
ncbi:MAG: hypothetical protein J6I53_12265 [Treponema sp.]|nr:hypothetical protein [Treponema sp.]